MLNIGLGWSLRGRVEVNIGLECSLRGRVEVKCWFGMKPEGKGGGYILVWDLAGGEYWSILLTYLEKHNPPR